MYDKNLERPYTFYDKYVTKHCAFIHGLFFCATIIFNRHKGTDPLQLKSSCHLEFHFLLHD